MTFLGPNGTSSLRSLLFQGLKKSRFSGPTVFSTGCCPHQNHNAITPDTLTINVSRRQKLNLYFYSYCMCWFDHRCVYYSVAWCGCEFNSISRLNPGKAKMAPKRGEKRNYIFKSWVFFLYGWRLLPELCRKPFVETLEFEIYKIFLRSCTFHLCSLQKYFTSLQPSSCSTEPERIRDN